MKQTGMPIAYSIILPAYNEADNIEKAIRETAAVFDPLKGEYEMVVVDDGSTDATAEIVERLAHEIPAVRLLRHEGNCGKGTAVRTGVMNAHGDHIFFFDCDLATHPREAISFIDRIGEYDVAIGSRRAAGAVIVVRQSWYRILYGQMVNFFIRHFFKLPYRDTQCGFKMFRRNAAQDIFKVIGPSRWVFDVEVLLRARANGYKIIELPVAWSNGTLSRVKFNEVVSDLWYLSKLRNKLDR